jgi:pimeloyl-ACP methyl ester carboxylesterase
VPLDFRTIGQIAFYEGGPADDSSELPTYFLLHGIGTSLDFWTAVAPKLALSNRTIALDIPGFGRSRPAADRSMTVDGAAAQMAWLAEELDVTNGVLVAHSLGAFFALRLSALASEHFHRVILVSGTLKRVLDLVRCPHTALAHPILGFNVSLQFAAGALPFKADLAAMVARSQVLRGLFLRPWVGDPGRLDPDLLRSAFSNVGGIGDVRYVTEARQLDFRALLQQVTQPVDLLWGQRDSLINKSDVEFMSNWLCVERQLPIADCGHWPMLEFPNLVIQFILESANLL